MVASWISQLEPVLPSDVFAVVWSETDFLAAMMIIYGETQQGKDAGVPIMDWAFANEPTLHRNENTTKCRVNRHFV
jgi:hypothetical protein